MGGKVALHIPVGSFDGIAGREEGKFLDDLTDQRTAGINEVTGTKGQKLLLNVRDLAAREIANMELLAPGKELPLHRVAVVSVLILHRKAVIPCEELLIK